MIDKHAPIAMALLVTFVAVDSFAQEKVAAKKDATPTSVAPAPKETAPQLVREGNKLLLDDKADLALEKYDLAKTLAPEAREIAFAEGLSHFKLGDYATAREEFSQVAGSAGDALADDALYSKGTCDHAEALASSENPEQAMGKLESAMRTYRDVLGRNPNHQAARDANFKAASMWRQIKKQMEQQKQEQKKDGEGDDDNEKKDDQEKQDQQEQNDEKSDEDQEQSDQQESEDQQKEDQESSESEQDQKEKEQKQEQSKSDEQKESDQQQAQQSEEEQVSQEQAERKLREMLQELKDRQKARKKPVKRVPPPRGGKDW